MLEGECFPGIPEVLGLISASHDTSDGGAHLYTQCSAAGARRLRRARSCSAAQQVLTQPRLCDSLPQIYTYLFCNSVIKIVFKDK